MGKIVAVCISEEKGTAKKSVGHALVGENHGLQGDAHAGNWHRQVSLLSYESIEQFKAEGAEVNDGDFGENLIVSGIPLTTLPVGTRLQCGAVLLEVTQIGKECHHGCQIFQRMGRCIMPHEGVFTRVLHGGEIHEQDEIEVLPAEGQRVTGDIQ